MPEASSDGSVASPRQHSEARLAQYFDRLFGMRQEKEHAGCIRRAAFNALVGYSGINFSESEMAAIRHAVSTMEADGMVQYKGLIPLLVAIAHQASMPEASSDGS